MMNNKQVKVYTFTIPANGAFPLLVISDYFRIQAATGAVDVEGDTFGTLPDLLTGQGLENTPYNRLTFVDKTGAPNTVSVLCSGDLFIDNRLYGVVSIDGDVALTAATIAAIRGVMPTDSYADNSAAVAGNVVLVPAGTNVNGLWVASAQLQCYSDVSSAGCSLLAKATAPASTEDGQVLLFAGSTAAGYLAPTQLSAPQWVAPGLGLHIYNSVNDSATAAPFRAARWQLL